MPAIDITSNVAPKDLPTFIRTVSKSFSSTIGKPESFTMVSFTKADAMSLDGTTGPTALIRINSIGNIDAKHNNDTSAAIAKIIESELGVPADRYYIFFVDAARQDVGYNGATV